MASTWRVRQFTTTTQWRQYYFDGIWQDLYKQDGRVWRCSYPRANMCHHSNVCLLYEHLPTNAEDTDGVNGWLDTRVCCKTGEKMCTCGTNREWSLWTIETTMAKEKTSTCITKKAHCANVSVLFSPFKVSFVQFISLFIICVFYCIFSCSYNQFD